MLHLNRINKLLILILLLFSPIYVKAIVTPTENFYINDYANILSDETEKYIMNKSVVLNNIDGTQIVVVTVKNLEGYSLEEYATKLFRNFGIGDKVKNNGLLLLLALDERQFRVEVGYGLEGILPDGKTGRFQDEYIIPYLKNNNWDEGVKNGYDAFYSEIVKLNNLTIDYNDPIDNNISSEDDTLFAFFLYIFPFMGLISGRILRKLKNKSRRKKWAFIYIIIWILMTIYFFYKIPAYIIFMIINLILFIFGRICNESSSYGGYSGGSFGGSSGGFSGGGGASGGGGSSRGF